MPKIVPGNFTSIRSLYQIGSSARGNQGVEGLPIHPGEIDAWRPSRKLAPEPAPPLAVVAQAVASVARRGAGGSGQHFYRTDASTGKAEFLFDSPRGLRTRTIALSRDKNLKSDVAYIRQPLRKN